MYLHILCLAGSAGLAFKNVCWKSQTKTVRFTQKALKASRVKGIYLKRPTLVVSNFLAPTSPSPFCLHRQATLRVERLGEAWDDGHDS